MRLLIVAATEIELGDFIRCKNRFPDTDVLITGIGMVSTAFAIGRKLHTLKYDFAVNAGIAGAYNRNLNIGQVVNVVSDAIAEMGAEEGEEMFIPFHKLDVEKLSQKFPENGIILNKSDSHNNIINSLFKAKAISVNTITGSDRSIKRMRKFFNPDIEAMEGAAFMFACNEMNIPFVQIRAVSNYVEKRNTENWNINLAISNLNNTLFDILDNF